MKKYLCLLWGGLLLAASCQKTPENPSVSLAAGEAGENSLTFTITTANADAAAWVVVKDGETVPSAAEILETGTAAETGTSEVSADNLESGTDYVVAAAAGSGSLLSEVATLKMTTGCLASINSTHTAMWYYGEQSEGINQFLVQLADVECDGYNLRPQDAGHLIRLYLITEPVADPENPVLTPGTYTAGSEEDYTPGTFVSSIYAEGPSGDVSAWTETTVTGGEVTVAYEDGAYTIEARLVIGDGNESVVRGSFSGECLMEDLSDGVRYFYEDIENQKFDWMGMTIYDSNGLGSINATAGNCLLDENGYVAGAGYVMTFNLYTPAVSYGDMAFEGTYTVKTEITEYAAYAGYLYDYGSMIMPVGNYITYYGENGASQYVGLITGGAIEISRDGETYTVKSVDLVTSTGCSVDFEYSGAINPVYDYRTQTSAAATSSAAPEVTLGLGEVWTPAR